MAEEKNQENQNNQNYQKEGTQDVETQESSIDVKEILDNEEFQNYLQMNWYRLPPAH